MKKLSRVDQIMMEILREAEAAHYSENRPTGWKDYNYDVEKGFRFMANNTTVIRMYKPLPDTLSVGEVGMLLDCAQFLEPESNMLFYRSDRSHKAMSVRKLAAALGMSVSYVYRFVSRMCRLRVMAKEQRRLYINPIYFFRGRYLSSHLYSLFRQELQLVLPQWVVDKYEGNENRKLYAGA